MFHGPKAEFSSGLVVHRSTNGWEVIDETGQLGPAGVMYGTFATEADACRAALRVLRARLSEPVVPCWGAGAPNEALAALGYDRGRLCWRWWPPAFIRVGESVVGVDGRPGSRSA